MRVIGLNNKIRLHTYIDGKIDQIPREQNSMAAGSVGSGHVIRHTPPVIRQAMMNL